MKKRIITLFSLCAVLLSSCGSTEDKDEVGGKNDTTLVPETEAAKTADPIIGKMGLVGTAKIGHPINIKFSVYNNADTITKFCKWHTPFEKLSSKYLDVTFEDFTDVAYKGAMSKRIMPPPANSYITLKKGDSTSINFNLADGYEITKAGVYTIKYNATTISGVFVIDSLKINVEN